MGAENDSAASARDQTIFRAAGRTDPNLLAGAIAGVLRDQDHLMIQAIGAHAVNQAIKAVIIARKYLVDEGIDLDVTPRFSDIVLDGAQHTVIILDVDYRPREQ